MAGDDTQTASHVLGRERPSRVWTLTLVSGPGLGAQSVVRHGETILLGRGATAFGEPLQDERLSRKHLELDVDGSGELLARDLGSRNGSFLNAERFERAEVHDGQLIGIGRTLLFAEPGEVVPTPPGAPEGAVSVAHSVALAAVARGIARDAPIVLSGPAGVGKQRLVDWIAGERPIIRWRPDDPPPEDLADSNACVAVELLEAHPSASHEALGTPCAARLVVTTQLSLDAFLSGTPVPHAVASRLGGGFVRIPTLAERRADIPLIAQTLVAEHDPGGTLDPELVFRLVTYGWPGNLHQLHDVVEQCIAASEDVVALPPDLDALLSTPRSTTADVELRALAVRSGGTGFRFGTDEEHPLSPSSPTARVLWALARPRAMGNLAPIDPDDLVRAVWPNETLVRRSGRNRLYVALSALRKAGLADVIERSPAGYRVSPSIDVVIEGT